MTYVPTPRRTPSWLEALNVAVCKGLDEKVKTLLAQHAKDPLIGDVNGHWDSELYISGSALVAAVRCNREDMVALLVNHPSVDVNAVCEMVGLPPLFYAVRHNEEVVEMLLDAGADPKMSVVLSDGETWDLPKAVVSSFDNAAGVLDVLSRRHLLPTSDEDLAQLLILAVEATRMDFPNSAVLWLLDHGAPITGVNAQGEDLGVLTEKLRTSAPIIFLRLEKAILHQDTTPTGTLSVPLKRARL